MAINSFQISRRSFVKPCAATAAATGLPVWFLEREEFTGDSAREANSWLAREMRKPHDYGYAA
jgi:hypothetical protein